VTRARLRWSKQGTGPPPEACTRARFPSGAGSLTLTAADRMTSALQLVSGLTQVSVTLRG
jgi:hypothetical protein